MPKADPQNAKEFQELVTDVERRKTQPGSEHAPAGFRVYYADKCDGQRPSCSACVANGQVCLYDPTTKKRGLPEGYVRGLEKLWALSMVKIQGLEDAVSSLMEEHRQELLDIWNHDNIGEDLHTTWKESRVLRELETTLSRLEYDSSSIQRRSREKAEPDRDMEETTEQSLHLLPTFHIATGVDLSALDVPSLSTQERFQQQPSAPTLDALLPSTAPALIDTYFSLTHCWFPIIERHRVLRASYSYSRQPAKSESYKADLAVLWALLAYTDRQGVGKVAFRADSEILEQSSDLTSGEMRTIARQLIPDEQGPYEIGHVQALLLLVLLDLGLGHWSSAWALVGQATRIALELGLGANSKEKRGIGVLYGCFMLDTLVAAHLVRLPHLRRQDMANTGHLDEDGYEEWDPWTNAKATNSAPREPAFMISCFNRLVAIFMILNDIICDKRQGPDRQAFFRTQADELRDMPSKFPMLLGSQAAPHHVYLQLFHLSTNILVLRESFEGGAPADPLARLASEILVLLTEYAQNPMFGLAVIPPVLEGPVRSACYAAIAARPSFDQLPSLPSYNAFARKMTDHNSELYAIWPVFSGLTKLWQKELQVVTFDPFSRTNNGTTSNWPVDIQIPPPQHHDSNAALDQGGTAIDLEGLELPMSGLAQPNSFLEQSSMPAGLSMPASDPSPSYQGDDVDAIFYNLAHLDTTDWMHDREQGLQDFGFADETTFQAFCNDPERLATSKGTTFGSAITNPSASFWPPPGFFPGHFADPHADPQLEASHILQALSGTDIYPSVPEGVGW